MTRWGRETQLPFLCAPADGACCACGACSSDKFYIVTDGEVVVTQTPEGGEEKEICRLGQGAYFGELALLTNQARKATITAVGDVTVVSVARKVFTRVMVTHPPAPAARGPTLCSPRDSLTLSDSL